MRTLILLLCLSVTAALGSSEITCWCSSANVPCHCSTAARNSTATAWGNFIDTVEQKGWGELHVHSNPLDADELQAYGAGFVEGVLTSARIHQHFSSFYEATFGGNDSSIVLPEATSFVEKNDAYMASRTNSSKDDPWWHQAALVWKQLDGLIDGYNSCADKKLARLDFLLMNAVVDLSSIIHKPFANEEWTKERVVDYERRTTHCSAIIKLADDFSELYTSHNTWTAYYMMLRVVKHYDLPYANVQAKEAMSSGYFGTLSSTDDFFVLSNHLVVQETTNGVFNKTLLAQIRPTSVLTWVRSLIANKLATGGKSWTDEFAKENSGTINNQWHVVDYNLFTPGKPLKPNTLWILEQLPTLTQAADMTHTLALGYWPSYNKAYFPAISALSGQDDMVAKFGNDQSYELAIRAKIFRRDHGGVKTREALRRLMRYNQFATDPYSGGDACGGSLACRGDLLHPMKDLGNIDAKIVSREDVLAMRFEAVSGPTHDDQPVFEWNSVTSALAPHYGQPTRFDFSWENFTASSIN